MATFFQAKKKLPERDGGSGGAGAAYGATMWTPGMPGIPKQEEKIRETDSDPQPFTGQKPSSGVPSTGTTPESGGLVKPPPGGRDNPFVNGTVTLPTVSTATTGTTPAQPTINTPAPIPVLPPPPPGGFKPSDIGGEMNPKRPEIEKVAPPPVQQSPYNAPTPYVPSPRAPTRTQGNTSNRVNELYSYGQQAMANPSRYDSELMQANAKVIEDAIARMRETGMRNLGEHYASRGLTGSSLEGFGVSDLEGELGRYANERATGLMTDAAQTFSQDRSSAFGMGASAAGLGLQGENAESDNAYRDWQGEQSVYNTGRTQDQNELSLLASIADRFGPEALAQLGYGGADTGYAPTGGDPFAGGNFTGTPTISAPTPPSGGGNFTGAAPTTGAIPSMGSKAPQPGTPEWQAGGWGWDINGNPVQGVAGTRSDYGPPR